MPTDAAGVKGKGEMKVFVPMSDATLRDNNELYGKLVPFNPEFVVRGQTPGEGRKPKNWISDCNYEDARERLFSTQA